MYEVKMTSNEKENLPALPEDDGFVPVAPSQGQIIVGTFLRFTDGSWTEMGIPVPSGLKLLVIAVNEVLQRWADERVVDMVTEKPLPNVDDLNAQIPESEWEKDLNGNPRPPWVHTYVAYLLHEQTAEKYTYANSTTGARICVETLQDRVAWMRKLRGSNVVPEVELTSRPMTTRFGIKQRPEFKIVGWKKLGDDGHAPPTPQITGPATPGIADVKPVPTSELLNDDLPF
jgi:hypothetical protein